MEAILALYRLAYDPRRPLICFDEASYQLLEHIRNPLPVQPGIPAKQDTLSMGFHNGFSLDEKEPFKETLQNLT
jgi:hypothetical protein